MTQKRGEPGQLTTAEIRRMFIEMGLGSQPKREKLLEPRSPISEQGEQPIMWIDASTGTATWQLPSEEDDAELE